MNEAAWQKWFEGVWAQREEEIYRGMLGDLGPGIYAIPKTTFEKLGTSDPDPRYLTHGVFECPPTDARPSWAYISSGMSNPWGENPETVDPRQFSGLGFEFLLQTRSQSSWAIPILHWLMAVQLLVASEVLEGHLVELDDRIELGGIIPGRGEGSAAGAGLTHLIVTTPEAFGPRFELASGVVDLMQLVGSRSGNGILPARRGRRRW